MFGLQYNWLLSVRGMSVRLARGGLLTLAVGCFCVVCALIPRSAPLTAAATAAAPATAAIQQTTDTELPRVLVRLWILVPRLLPQR